jgi:hypothetical protein
MLQTLSVTLSLFCLQGFLYAQAPSPRMSDKDLARLMKNVYEDARRLRSSFKKAVEKSSIRKTSREKEAKQLADRFAEQAKGMARTFEEQKKADTTLPVVYQSLNQLERIVQELGLSGVVTSDLEKVKTELGQVAEQFAFTPPT